MRMVFDFAAGDSLSRHRVTFRRPRGGREGEGERKREGGGERRTASSIGFSFLNSDYLYTRFPSLATVASVSRDKIYRSDRSSVNENISVGDFDVVGGVCDAGEFS